MRPVWLFVATLLLSAAVHADSAPPQKELEAEARFLRSSFDQLIDQFELPSAVGRRNADVPLLLCRAMCDRLRRDGLTPSLDCSAQCADASVPVNPSHGFSERAPARSDPRVSRDSSSAVVSATAPENPQP